MGPDHIKEAGWVVNAVVGSSSYLYAVGYDKKLYQREIDETVAHIRANAITP